MIIPESCKGCGKCCIWVDLLDKPIHYFCPNCKPNNIVVYYGRCMYLNDKNECGVYNNDMPKRCLLFERGSDKCISFLQSHENINNQIE